MNIATSFRSLGRSPATKLVQQGDAARDAHRWPEAAEAYGKALEIDPALEHIWVQHGHALKESGDLDRAEQSYRRALALEAGNFDTHLQLGHLLKLKGKYQAAADSYLTALEVSDGPVPDALRELQDLGSRSVRLPAERLHAVLEREAGLVAADADPFRALVDQGDALFQALLGTAGETGRVLDPAQRERLEEARLMLRELATPSAEEKATADAGTAIVFDASDLIHHFRHSRVVTGIQRVQLEIIASLIGNASHGSQICSLFDNRWVRIPTRLFATLARLSAQGSDTQAHEWRAATTRLELILRSAEPFTFPRGACLVSLGTSWFVDYLLHIRNAKRDYGIRYIPFVHDLIPIVAPRFVLPDVVADFVGWLHGVFDQADLFLTNSQSTARDLVDAATRLGVALDAERDIVVMPLDARFVTPEDEYGHGQELLRRNGLIGQAFVLFVSTIEPRKNHLAALDAWQALLDERGGKPMPKLVCVGGRGWMNEAVFQRVAQSPELGRHVLFLHGLSDIELAACYDACLFTLYPSHYEGWGLPVTESLCRGKVPLLTHAASLPEAGGAFAVYCEPGSVPSLVAALRRLIDEPQLRLEHERAIAERFVPRRWSDLADQVAQAVSLRFGGDEQASPGRDGIATLHLGHYYPFSRNLAQRLADGLTGGEPFRIGEGWHTPEPWGCWTRPGGACLRFRVAQPGRRHRLYLFVSGIPHRGCRTTVEVNGTPVAVAPLEPSEQRWIVVAIEASAALLEICISSDVVQELGEITEGKDTRVIAPGIIGMALLAEGDIAGRLDLAEAIATRSLKPGRLGLFPDGEADAAPPPADAVPATAQAEDEDPSPEPEQSAEPARVSDAPLVFQATIGEPPQRNATRGQILVLQTSDPENYRAMLTESERTTKRYCERHGYRHQSFVGLKRGDLPWHATYNRIDLLHDLVKEDFQGWVLWIDADAWIVDLDFDLSAYLADKDHIAMIGSPAGNQRDHFWNINIGVMLFNLAHPLTRAVIAHWEAYLSRYDLERDARGWNVEIADDQGMFHQIVDKYPDYSDAVLIVDKAFLNSPWASFVRQAIRAENHDFEARLSRMREEVAKVLSA